jgi:hypothetical protein
MKTTAEKKYLKEAKRKKYRAWVKKVGAGSRQYQIRRKAKMLLKEEAVVQNDSRKKMIGKYFAMTKERGLPPTWQRRLPRINSGWGVSTI